MRKSTPAQWVIRVLIYILGLLCLAFGVAVATNSGLGISPVNSLPFVVSAITPEKLGPLELNPGNCVTIVFCIYILLQVLILRKDFKPINLTQIIFSFIFGQFVNVTKAIVGDWAIPTYPGKLVMLAISIVLIAIGVILYLDVKLVPMPMEGLSLVFADKTNTPFPKMKMIVDCLVVVLGVVLSFLFLRELVYIREGTVLTAVFTGPVMGLLRKPLSPVIEKVCFGGTETCEQ